MRHAALPIAATATCSVCSVQCTQWLSISVSVFWVWVLWTSFGSGALISHTQTAVVTYSHIVCSAITSGGPGMGACLLFLLASCFLKTVCGVADLLAVL